MQMTVTFGATVLCIFNIADSSQSQLQIAKLIYSNATKNTCAHICLSVCFCEPHTLITVSLIGHVYNNRTTQARRINYDLWLLQKNVTDYYNGGKGCK